MNRKIYTVLSLLIMVSSLFAQNNSEPTPDFYRIGRYYFYPEKKQVEINQYYEEDNYYPGNNGEVLKRHSWGYKNCPTDVDYENTTIYFLGGYMYFEEDLKKANIPYEDIHVLYQNLGSDFAYTTQCGDSVFLVYRNRGDFGKTDISDMISISGNLYRSNKNNKIYALVNAAFGVVREVSKYESELPVLKYVAPRHYLGNDGLYSIKIYNGLVMDKLDGETDVQQAMIETNPYYIVYNGKVYYIAHSYNTFELDLDPERIRIISSGKLYSEPLLTDGTKVYEGSHEQRNIPGNISGLICEKKTFYRRNDTIFMGRKEVPGATNVELTLYASADRPLLPAGYNKIMIYNHKVRDYEDFELSEYRFISDDFYVYKDLLYGIYSYPVYEQEKINVKKLAPVIQNGVNTNFYRDGNSLIYACGGSGLCFGDNSVTKDGELILGKNLIGGVDFKTLQVGGLDVLVDKNNIYSGDKEFFNVIPLDKLGIRVKTFTEN